MGHDAGSDNGRVQHRGADPSAVMRRVHIGDGHRSCFRMTIAEAGHAD
jgi:hypothetical protein